MRLTESNAPQSGGRPLGGPLCFVSGRFRTIGFAVVLLAAGAAACASGSAADRPRPGRAEVLARPLEIYRDLGFLTGPAQFPVVASFSTMAGPADSTWLLVGLSIPNSALRFQRDAAGFHAEYAVEITLMQPDSVLVQRHVATQSVKIPAFRETGRTDESIVFQHALAVQPGSYLARVQAVDQHSSRGFRVTDTVTVPAYGTSAFAPPLLVYQAEGRTSRDELPSMILNPRHTVPYGGAPLLYLESYGADAPVDVQVVNATGSVLWRARVPLDRGEAALRHAVLAIPADTLPLGQFWIEISHPAAPVQRAPLVLTISDQWMVAHFEDVLHFLRFIAHTEELDSLRSGSPAERRERWESFWDRRNPLPQAGFNEYRDRFFQRVRYATEAFREPGERDGWATDRGEVYIVLGAPDHVIERFIGGQDVTGRPNAEEWVYVSGPAGRMNLLFQDRTGFGRLELVPSSVSTFRAAAERLKPPRR